MANIKSQKKRILTNEKDRLSNKAFNTRIKTAIKKAQIAKLENTEDQEEIIKVAASLVDRGVKRGIIKPNKASRTKTHLMRK